MIAGVDFSTRTVDVVLLSLNGDEAMYLRRHIEAETALRAARNVRDAMPERKAWADVLLVGIERPFGHPASVSALLRVQGAVLACIPPDIPVHEMAPTSWKKSFTGRGHASKADVRARARPFFAPDALIRQDTADACGIAYAARELYRTHYGEARDLLTRKGEE